MKKGCVQFMVKYIVQSCDGKYYNAKEKTWLIDSNGATRWKTRDSLITELQALGFDPSQYSIIPMEGLNKADVPENIMSSEDAESTYSKLDEAVATFGELNDLLTYYAAEQRRYDEMEQDILHRIEFGSIIGLAGMRLVKQLKDVRIKRREAKDKVQYLLKLQNCFKLDIKKESDKFFEAGKKKIYIPRQLPELFN